MSKKITHCIIQITQCIFHTFNCPIRYMNKMLNHDERYHIVYVGSLVAFSPFSTLSVVTEPVETLYTTMRSPLECVETHRLVISRFCQLLDRLVIKIDRNLASKPSTVTTLLLQSLASPKRFVATPNWPLLAL